MTTVAINQALLLGLVVLFAPLSLVWAYALYDSVRGAIASERAGTKAGRAADPDLSSWPVLLLLTGFFGAIAYLCLVLIPRLQRPRARVRLQAIRAL